MSDSSNQPTVPAQLWNDRVTAFAAAIKKTPEEVTAALTQLVGEPSDDAIRLFANEQDAQTAEIVALFPGVARVLLNKAIREILRGNQDQPAAAAASAPAATATASAFTQATGILPAAPDDESFIAALRLGGALQVDATTVAAAIRAAFANNQGLYQLPKTLAEKMVGFAESMGKPVGPDYLKLRKMLARRNYAEILGLMGDDDDENGLSVSVTQADKNALLAKLDTRLWSALAGFQSQLKLWIDSWQGSANPGMLMAFLAAGLTGNGHQLPPGMMQPPDTSALRAAAEAVNDQINSVFAGLGAPTARALAFDALHIKEVLQNPTLPAQLGEPNTEQMLRNLHLGVSAADLRIEKNLVQFALAVMNFGDPTKVSTEIEVAYLGQLYSVGQLINFDALTQPKGSGGAIREWNPR